MQFLSPVSKALFFYQNSPKIKWFLQKMQNFRALGALPPNPQTPKTAPPPLRISGNAPGSYCVNVGSCPQIRQGRPKKMVIVAKSEALS